MTTLTFTLNHHVAVLIALALLATAILCIVWIVHHQRVLKTRAHLMREAMRNHDFTFRLPIKGLLPGERALQEALNDLGTDISRLVAENEQESWQKLVRVLTHEIMNATAPICSISRAYLDNPTIKDSPFEEGIRAIHSATSTLTTFTGNFRKLTQLQKPVLQRISVPALAGKIRTLFPTLKWQTDIPEDATMPADEGMLLQVMTNLVKNAQEAGASTMALHWDGSTLLISNNGEPIPAPVLKNIFIPFFTTKPGGSGIGLALSRQLMISQGGNLWIPEKPMPGWHVTFALKGQ